MEISKEGRMGTLRGEREREKVGERESHPGWLVGRVFYHAGWKPKSLHRF